MNVRVVAGQVWCERGKDAYRPGENVKRPRLWLVVRGPRQSSRSPQGKLTVTLLSLEGRGLRRVNQNVMKRRGRKGGWELWHDPPALHGQTEPREK